jgi:hypothetical protein
MAAPMLRQRIRARWVGWFPELRDRWRQPAHGGPAGFLFDDEGVIVGTGTVARAALR